ncbi:1-acyl-sn-glycerol-3-phosphate acyltransferase beta isoform X1 [Trichogramma pretiosum]|uniref:1-acyl-sn-glycerol-3-phosphate acyltransferase beta isoform X1 n=2 Tax=Trichogramma pretiosum TaxID=7493 RepID=UPI000C71A3B8|nr:1-acyl-sn-glycerol-3-phosphate acyltransferase beta isoform X1 [Trichogramma pretiosum]
MALALQRLKKRYPSVEMEELKPPRKNGRFDGLTEEEVAKNTLKDILKPNLDLVFVGINPSLMAAHTGSMIGISCSSIGVALFLLSVVICTISEAARYHAKHTIFVLSSAIWATCPIPLMFFRMRDWRNALIPAWGARQTGKLIGINYKIRGKENIVKDSGAVVLINHQSNLDLCVLAELWPVMERCTVISKKEVMYFGTFGLASWLWGTIFIDRNNKKEAQSTVNSTAEIIKKRKARVLIYPEGKRYGGPELLPFKKGGFHVAIDSQMPIQPVVVSRYYFINSKLKKFDSGTSYITILPPIPTEGLTKEDIPKLIDEAYEKMNKVYQESTQEALSVHMEALKIQ